MKLLTYSTGLLAAALALSACGGSQKVMYTAGPDLVHPKSYAYAYLVPTDPAHPGRGGYGTLVRFHPVSVGDRIPPSALTTAESGEPHLWKVVSVRATARDGTPAAILGWRHKKNPTWHGRLVLRPLG
jgi:hypothetical protein